MTTPDRWPDGRPAIGGRADSIAYRPAVETDLPACGDIWRTSINDYTRRLNQPDIPNDLTAIGRLHAHIRSTDPNGFWVAELAGPDGGDGAEGTIGGDRIVAFVASLRRGGLWFLSMLFVLPEHQARGVGRELLARVMPAPGETIARATATDSAQPISNGLYSSYGIVPRMPLLNIVGRPNRPAELPTLPDGIDAIPFEAIADPEAGGNGHADLAATINALDRELLGVEHPQDHRWIRMEGRRGFLFRGPDGAVQGYGYTSALGRIGPVAVRDETLLGPILAHLLTVIEPRGASALWVPGAADRAIVPLLAAGMRIEGFPVIACWDRPFARWDRYLPISPGLL